MPEEINTFMLSPEQSEIAAMVWECDCHFRATMGRKADKIYLSSEAIEPFPAMVKHSDGETDVEIWGSQIYYDPTLKGKSCYCRYDS